jgi:predicted lipoprotein with Yx(FWY)xxD motif
VRGTGRHMRMVAGAAAAALALAACGGKGGGGLYGAGASSPKASATASTGTNSARVGTTSIHGIGTVLDDARGFTVYHLTSETGGAIKCTGACASTWPPVLATGGSVPKVSGSLPGTLSTIRRPDGGMQVTYRGLPLYTYSGDMAAGEANGQGIQGVWFAVTPSGDASAANASTGGGASGSSGSAGYGFGGGYGSGGGNG